MDENYVYEVKPRWMHTDEGIEGYEMISGTKQKLFAKERHT